MQRFKLFFIFIIASTHLASAQFAEFPKNEWHFSLHADYFPQYSLAKNSTGYTDVMIQQTGGYRMAFGYRRYIAAGFFAEAKLSYGRLWMAYQANYDSLRLNNINADTLQNFKPIIQQKYERETIALTFSTGIRNHLFKGVDGHLKLGLRLNHFLQAQIENKRFFYFVKQGNSGIGQQYVLGAAALPGGKEKHLNNRSYIMPILELEAGISINPEKWKNRALHLNFGFSCACLTEEAEGSMQFTYYDINQDVIGTTNYQSRLLSLSIGLGLSF